MSGRVTPFNSADWSSADVSVPAAGNQAQVSYSAAGFGMSHVISGIAWSYSAAPTGGRLQVGDNNYTVLDIDITASGAGSIIFSRPMRGTPNTALIVTLAAGGGAVSGKLCILGHWIE
jgi:hypothetical protein